uniref:intercellular adhesion molecule 1-like isoform X3 n=1 Tax=Oncorhynchus gorbuscha TaxID=8017 RepID=UPI001EAEC618|nr:intercellular adhesion molecule 1-like isoform X3 [Oncorhynchus gorbuscha]
MRKGEGKICEVREPVADVRDGRTNRQIHRKINRQWIQLSWMAICLFLTLPGVPTHASCPVELNPPRVVVRYGDSVSVNCTTSTDPEGMGWEVTFGGIGLQENVSFVTWTVGSLMDWTIEPKCYINLQNESQCTEILPVILYKTPDSVSISPLSHSGPMMEGKEYQLQCDIQNIAPLQNLVVRWYKGNETIETQTFNDSTKELVNMSSTITITHKRYEGEVEYRCEAELDLGPEGPKPTALSSKPLNVTVYSHTNKSTTPTAKSLTTADARWDEPFNYGRTKWPESSEGTNVLLSGLKTPEEFIRGTW